MNQSVWGQIYTETLPSGARVRVKRISVLSLLWAGGFPAELTGLVWKMANQEVDVKKLTEDPEGLRKMVGIIEQVVPHVLVSPRVALGEKDQTALQKGQDGVWVGTVLLADIPDLDKQWLMLFGQGLIRPEGERAEAGAKTGPESFPDESVRADAGPDGAEVRPAAVSDSGAAA